MIQAPSVPNPLLEITDEVAQAIADDVAVVALESTIISHGMPYPQNVEMAIEVERLVRANGAVPATIAILDGVPKIGLSAVDLELLATAPDVHKVSLRDIAYVMAKNLHGATTVASTMRLAALARISVFVTGGIGGVHKGAESSFDISADLTEMAATNVAVVSAGVKSILDIGLTLEMMETLSIPAISFQSSDFPSFYSRTSGFGSPMRADTPEEIAAIMRTKWALAINGGLSIANPIPAADEIPVEEMDVVIAQALRDMATAGISGKDATPYLLGRIVELTDGASLQANIALVKNNAVVGAQIASAYAAGAP